MKKANRSGTERETGCPFAEGSVTVETALVMPLLLVTVLSVLYLTIHVRNDVVLHQAVLSRRSAEERRRTRTCSFRAVLRGQMRSRHLSGLYRCLQRQFIFRDRYSGVPDQSGPIRNIIPCPI